MDTAFYFCKYRYILIERWEKNDIEQKIRISGVCYERNIT